MVSINQNRLNNDHYASRRAKKGSILSLDLDLNTETSTLGKSIISKSPYQQNLQQRLSLN